MRKYTQPKTAKPAPRDATLSLRLQKLQEAVSTLQSDLQLAVEAGLLPSGWSFGDITPGTLDVTQCGSATLTATATYGDLSSSVDIPINVAIAPEITVTPSLLPDGWEYNSDAMEITLNSNGAGTLDVSVDNGGGFVSSQSINITSSVPDSCPAGVSFTPSNVYSDLPLISSPIYSGDWPGDLNYYAEYEANGLPPGWRYIFVSIPIGECGTIEATFRINL